MYMNGYKNMVRRGWCRHREKKEAVPERATPLRHLRCALRRTCGMPAARVSNIPDSKHDRQLIVIGFTTFSHSTPLHCAIRPLGTLFSFF